MSAAEHPERPSTPARPTSAPPPSAGAVTKPGSSGSLKAALVMLILGVIGGIAAWLLIQRYDEFFQVPPEVANASPLGPPEEFEASLQAINQARRDNAVLCVALFGASLGGLLGLGAGMLRSSVVRAVVGLAGGVVLGAGFGVGGGYAELWVEDILKPVAALSEPLKVMAKYAAAFIAMSIGISLAVWIAGRPSFRPMRTVLTGAAAGLVAALLYVPLATFLFPLENSENVIPTGDYNRLFWTTLAAGLIGLAIGRTSRSAEFPKNERP